MYSFKLVEEKVERMRGIGQNDRIARYMSVCTSKRFRKDLGVVDIKDNVLLHYNFDTDEKRVIKGNWKVFNLILYPKFQAKEDWRALDL